MTKEEAVYILGNTAWLGGNEQVQKVEEAIKTIEDLPSAQPEQFTDEEQRIFLSAMAKEEKVCKHVDDVYKDSDEDSLVKICHEITRKVKGVLWT